MPSDCLSPDTHRNGLAQQHPQASPALAPVQGAVPFLSEAGPALLEAPASATVQLTLAGHQVRVTLRDTDETRLLARIKALVQGFPEEMPAPASTPPVCPSHGPMRESAKDKGTWYCPTKMADGSWCKTRHPTKFI